MVMAYAPSAVAGPALRVRVETLGFPGLRVTLGGETDTTGPYWLAGATLADMETVLLKLLTLVMMTV